MPHTIVLYELKRLIWLQDRVFSLCIKFGANICNKKLSYRRETARQLRTYTWLADLLMITHSRLVVQ